MKTRAQAMASGLRVMAGRVVWLLAVGALAACGSDDGAEPGDGNTTDEPTVPGAPCGGSCEAGTYCSAGACVAADECDIVGFSATNQAAIARFGGGQTKVRYIASNVEIEPPFDKLLMEVTHETFFDGEPGPGSFDLTGIDTSERGAPLYLRGHTYCNDFDCAFTYVVEAGTLKIDAPGTPGGMLTGTIEGLRLKQVRVDTNTGDIIPFSKGKVWCIGDYNFDREVPELSQAQGSCVADGTGNNVGDNIRNFALQNCMGDFVDLHERCGKTKAVWMVASAGWCGACESFVPVAAERYRELQGDGLDLMVIIGENTAGTQPSLEYCMDYALAKGVDPANVYVDHDGTRSWPEVFQWVNTYSGNSIGLPWNAVLDGRSMEYVWSSNAGSGDLYSVQQELLDRE